MPPKSDAIRLYRTKDGIVAEVEDRLLLSPDGDWDALIRRDDLPEHIDAARLTWKGIGAAPVRASELRAPIGSQEIWAAGVTYYRSRDARMEESKDAGGGSFYDRVYSEPRPELFFKAAAWRAIGPGGKVRIRADSKWNVPEPELTLVVSAGGRITGVTIGNDMSSRDIEGENPLYLPQAKVYDGSCAIGPAVLVLHALPPPSTPIEIRIERAGKTVFEGATRLSELKRRPEELVEYLTRETSFPQGCYLMTGTGIVPPNDFTLAAGDRITITVPPIGALSNTVAGPDER